MAISRLSETTLQNAFQKFNTVWDGRSAVSSYEFIASHSFTTNMISAEFNDIPQTYNSLQLRFNIVSTGTNMDWSFIMNGVSSGTSYAFHQLKGSGSAASSSGWSGEPYFYLLRDEYLGGVPSGTVLSGIIDIYDYANTSKLTTVRALFGTEQGTTGFTKVYSGVYNSTSAITRMTAYNGYLTWGAGSRFSLYGVK